MSKTGVQRPNRFDGVKDEEYHKKYAKWVTSNLNGSFYQFFSMKSLVNRAFYEGNQWIFDEDLDAFLMDESGDVRNRVKFVHNLIKPYVEYYRGSAVRLDISAKAKTVSRRAIARRIMYERNMMQLTKTANDAPPKIQNALREEFPIGETEKETKDMFANLYADKVEMDINDIIHHIKNRNNVEDFRVRLIENIALDGIGVLKEQERHGEQTWEHMDPLRHFFDTTTTRLDLKDCEYQGDFCMTSPVDIAEEFQNLEPHKRVMLDSMKATDGGNSGLHNYLNFYWGQDNSKLPKYSVYWRDVETDVFGVVRNKYGDIELVRIDDDEFSVEDVISQQEVDEIKDNYSWVDTALGGERMKEIHYDVCRYCIFIPSEYVTGAKEDVVLDWGMRKYTVKYSYEYKYIDYPYKAYAWNYRDGKMLTPIDDLIDPQRFLNRLLSIAESQVNNSRGSGTIFDKRIIDDQEGEEGIQRDINQGKPIFVNAMGQLNNSVGSYDNTIGQGTLALFNIANGMKAMADDIFGAGDALLGKGGGHRVSGKAIQQNLAQGVINQEPVFYALQNIFMQMYESMGERGRRIFLKNRGKLSSIVGAEGVRDLEATNDLSLEEISVEIQRSRSKEQEREDANATLLGLYDRQIIGQEVFAKYFDNVDLAGVGYAVREHMSLLAEAQRRQAKEQKEMSDKAMQDQYAEGLIQDTNKDMDRAVDFDKAAMGNEAKVIASLNQAQDQSKNEIR